MNQTLNTPSAGDLLQRALASVEAITPDNYWPLRSPAPSSTEAALKRELKQAREALEKATSLHRLLYGGSREQAAPPCITIKKIA